MEVLEEMIVLKRFKPIEGAVSVVTLTPNDDEPEAVHIVRLCLKGSYAVISEDAFHRTSCEFINDHQLNKRFGYSFEQLKEYCNAKLREKK